MDNCIVTFSSNVTAVSGQVKYEALPNQIIAGVAIDTTHVVATVASTDYTATLIQKARYRLVSPRFAFHNEVFTVPASDAANLSDLLSGYRAG